MIKRKDYGEIGFRELIAIKPEEFTINKLKELMAYTRKSDAKYDVQGYIKVPKEFKEIRNTKKEEGKSYSVLYAPNWNKIDTTTVGRLVANNILFSNSYELRKAFDYIDKPFDKKTVGFIEQRITDLVIQEEITMDDFSSVIDKMQHLGFGCTFFTAPSMTDKTITLPPKATKLKKKLLKDYSKEIAAKDLKVITDIEKQIIAQAQEELRGTDPGWEIYDSGARGSVGKFIAHFKFL